MNRLLSLFRSMLLLYMLWLPVSTDAAAAHAATIAVTLPPLAGLVTMLDAEAEVMCLLPAGADPHHFQLTPRKIEALSRTGLLVRAVRDDAGWPLPPSHARTLKLWPDISHGWLSPQAVRTALPLIADELIRLQPGRQATVAARLQAALQQVDAIEQEWRTVLAPLQRSGVLMQHPAWQSLLKAMGVPIFSVLESAQHGHEYGPHKLEQALATLQQHPQAWLLGDDAHSNRALDWLAGHVDQLPHRVMLTAIGSCGMPWPALMRENMARLSRARQP